MGRLFLNRSGFMIRTYKFKFDIQKPKIGQKAEIWC